MLVFILSSKFNGNGSRNDSKGKKIEMAGRVKRKDKKRKGRRNFGLRHRTANIFQMKKSNKLIIMRMYFI